MRYFKEECPNVIRDLSLAADGSTCRDPHLDIRQSLENCRTCGGKTLEARGAKTPGEHGLQNQLRRADMVSCRLN